MRAISGWRTSPLLPICPLLAATGCCCVATPVTATQMRARITHVVLIVCLVMATFGSIYSPALSEATPCYRLVKLIRISVVDSTGLPFRYAGRYRQLRTVAMAATARTGLPDTVVKLFM